MSGANVQDEEDRNDALVRIAAVLNRNSVLAPVEALRTAVSGRARDADYDVRQTAFGFDSSVFIRLAMHRRSADILDYLPQHEAPIILPGQTIQEFWNNRLSVIKTVSAVLKAKFEAFASEARKMGAEFDDFDEQMGALLTIFHDRFGYVYDEQTTERVSRMLEILGDHAECGFVPREQFSEIAIWRKRTKTPPGFRDEGDGDFFVWVDFLFTLSQAAKRKNFSHVVLLTNDQKPDWSTAGVPHPLLIAEVQALFDTTFDLWPLDKFADEIASII